MLKKCIYIYINKNKKKNEPKRLGLDYGVKETMIIHVMGLICVFLTSTTEPYDPVPKVISVGVTPFKMNCPSGRLSRKAEL